MWRPNTITCICNAVYFMVSCDFIVAFSYTYESQIDILFLKRDYHSTMLQISNKIMAKRNYMRHPPACSSGYNYNYIMCIIMIVYLPCLTSVLKKWIE